MREITDQNNPEYRHFLRRTDLHEICFPISFFSNFVIVNIKPKLIEYNNIFKKTHPKNYTIIDSILYAS